MVRCQKLTLLQNLQHQLFMSGGCAGSVSEEAKARAWILSSGSALPRGARSPLPHCPPVAQTFAQEAGTGARDRRVCRAGGLVVRRAAHRLRRIV